MLFSSYRFIFIFLPVVVLGYALLRLSKKDTYIKLWLIASSLCFYSFASIKFLPFLIGFALLNYFIGAGILHFKNKQSGFSRAFLTAGLIFDIGLLFFYKYFNFILDNMNKYAGTDFILLKIIVPLGISFYTFHMISYIINLYKNDERRYSLIDYFLYVTFFPYLIMGPITRHEEMLSQIDEKTAFQFDRKNIIMALMLFAIGCAKKVVLADPMITHAQWFYSNPDAGGFFESWTAMLSYTFAYYFDFSGYGNMACALALIFNIKIPINFNSPYKARNFTDFWHRWNITLSSFLNEYVFKSIYKFGDRFGKMTFAVMVTFLVSGLWHGEGWHFIAWGLFNGLFVTMSSYMAIKGWRLPYFIAWFLTFTGALIARVMFDAMNISQAFNIYRALISPLAQFAEWRNFWIYGINYLTINGHICLLILVSAIITFGFKNADEIVEKNAENWKWVLISGGLLVLAFFRMGAVSNFLYFQF